MLMRESLLDKQVMSATETPVVRMLPFCHVVKVGGRSIIDRGKGAVYPLVDTLGAVLANAALIKDITVSELKARNLATLPFDRVLIDLLACARQVKQFQIINGLKPHLLESALRGEHVGTIVRKNATA